jgi:hypothetical protein
MCVVDEPCVWCAVGLRLVKLFFSVLLAVSFFLLNIQYAGQWE